MTSCKQLKSAESTAVMSNLIFFLRRQLLSIEEAWNLPISAEMSSRQQQNPNGSSQKFQKSYTGSTPQGPPSPYPSPNGGAPTKRFKTEPDKLPTQPSFTMAPQQLQLLQYFQQNLNSLTPSQQNLMQHLQNQYRLMQQQARSQRSPSTPGARSAPTPPSYINFNQNGSPLNTAKSFSPTGSGDKLMQRSPVVTPRDFLSPGQHSSDITADNLEEDLEDLLSQKDLAATLAEDLLKHFILKGQTSRKKPTVLIRMAIIRHITIQFPQDLFRLQISILKQKCRPKLEEKNEAANGDITSILLSDSSPPPTPPDPPALKLSHQQLLPPTPSVYLDNKKHAFSSQLQEFCLKHPIAVVRGLASASKLDLGLFSTKTLVEANPDHSVEVRTQIQQPSDENWDPQTGKKFGLVFFIDRILLLLYTLSTRHLVSKTEEREKAAGGLSDSDSKDSVHNIVGSGGGGGGGGTRRKLNWSIPPVFGTNVDLSDERKWRPQLQELMKLPAFARVVSAANMLSHVGHVPGSRTPGHQENNNFCSININTVQVIANGLQSLTHTGVPSRASIKKTKSTTCMDLGGQNFIVYRTYFVFIALDDKQGGASGSGAGGAGSKKKNDQCQEQQPRPGGSRSRVPRQSPRTLTRTRSRSTADLWPQFRNRFLTHLHISRSRSVDQFEERYEQELQNFSLNELRLALRNDPEASSLMGNISFNDVLREIEEEMVQAAKAEQDRQREEEARERKKNNLYLEQKPRPSGSHRRVPRQSPSTLTRSHSTGDLRSQIRNLIS
nr:unnamed protein product [Callosobruchus chinensis]